MSTLAKIFVILNLLAAFVFTGFAVTLYSKEAKFKDLLYREIDAHIRDVRDKDAIVSQRDDVIEELDRALADRVRSVQELRTQNEELQRQIREREVRYIHAEQERQMLQAKFQEAVLELQRRDEQINDMHRIILKQEHVVEVARRNERLAINQRIDMENQLNRALHQRDDLRRRIAKIEADLQQHRWVMERLYAKGYNVVEIVYGKSGALPIVPIDAKVTAVRPDVGIVMLSVGSDDGVQRGFVFTVWRDDKYIGKVIVREIYPDMCSARINVGSTREEIAEGDNASTRLGGP